MFIKKKIAEGKNIGEKLVAARLEQGIDLIKAAKDTKIALKYLEALENNRPADLPGKTYLRNFLEQYANYLSLGFGELWVEAKRINFDRTGPRLKIPARHFLAWSKWQGRLLFILAILLILVFLFFKVKEIFVAPSLEILYPQDGTIFYSPTIEIKGQSESEVTVIINNQEIFVDQKGNFQTTLDLQKGLNLIKITAKKRYSRTQETVVRALLAETNDNQ